MKKLTKRQIKEILDNPKNYYCHLTSLNNVQSIVNEGIKANKYGDIFVYDDVCFKWYDGVVRYVGDNIAYNQVLGNLQDYAIFFIDKRDITGEVLPDEVGESTAKWQHIIKQDRIEPFHFIGRNNQYYTFKYEPNGQ